MGATIGEFYISSAKVVGVGGSVLSILTQFLSKRSHHVMVDGCRSKLVNFVSGVPIEGQCFGLDIVPLVHLRALLNTGE